MATPFDIQPVNGLQALLMQQQGSNAGYEALTKPIAAASQIKQMQARNKLQELLQGGGNPNLSDASLKLIAGGDLEGGTALANLARANAQDAWNRTYQGGMLDVARQNASTQQIAANKDQPQITTIGTPDGRKQPAIVNPSQRSVTPIGSPIGDEIKLTSGDRKAIFDAEDEQSKLKGTLDALTRARELAPQAFTGYTAGVRGNVGTNLPGLAGAVGINPESARATVELNQIMSGESIQNMSAVLKGATTDREMMEFKRIMADQNLPAELKLRTIDRMLTVAQRQMLINSGRMQQLRGGNYFRPGGGMDVNPNAQPAAQPNEGWTDMGNGVRIREKR